MRKLLFIALFALGFGISNQSNAQLCDTIATICSKHMSAQFISDGQTYRALLLNDQYAEFHTTFYGGTTYRIAACSGMTDGNLIFNIKDQEGNNLQMLLEETTKEVFVYLMCVYVLTLCLTDNQIFLCHYFKSNIRMHFLKRLWNN